VKKPNNSKLNVAIVLLAAGASRRMERAKQLLPWQEQSMIEHQINTLLQTDLPLCVVLGAHAAKIAPLIQDLPLQICINESWEKGMGNSLAYGIKEVISQSPSVSGILIALVDQPFLQVEHFKMIIQSFVPNEQQIICSKSDEGWSGPPVLFDRCYFKEMMEQDGDEGAKKLTRKYQKTITYINLGDVIDDIDTPVAFAKAVSRQS
tara:strand:- start:6766 stop:7383 length:618 start_codon:yes stop_codon:yes gene_type:complete